jgi:ELWxxDGT repeat protein
MNQSQAKKRRRAASKIGRNRAGRERFRARRLCLETLEQRLALTGTWTALTNLAPVPTIGAIVLLSNGSVLLHKTATNGRTSQQLTPDATGSYVNGSWSALAAENSPTAYASQMVLPDGRVLVIGGTNNSSPNSGEIYDPVANTWTNIAPFPESTFFNGPAALLPNGKVLAGSILDPNTYIYDPASDSWSPGPTKLFGDSSLNETWSLLAGGGVLSYDVNSNPGEAQRLDPTSMTWVDSGSVPVPLEAGISAFPTMGPGVLLPDGRLLQFGRSSQTAIYTPSTTPGGTGSWAAGPVIPNGLEAGGGAANANTGSAAAMLLNGHVLFDADMPDSGGPTRFFEFDPTAPLATSLTDVTPSIAQFQNTSENFATFLLVLPSGQVMLGINNGTVGGMGNQGYIYTPDGAPQAAWRPTITGIVADGTNYKLSGTQLNGISAGGSRGGSTEMATNYPIVELKNAAGNVYFARTFNWSSTGVDTGSNPETADFSLPASIPVGSYSLTVTANGIASTSVPFRVLLAGDFNFDGQLTGADVPAMFGALADLNAYKQAHGLSPADLLTLGDLNGDHAVTNADLQVLLNQLIALSHQPQLVLDINSNGSMGSVPANLTAIGGTVYFSASDGIHGNELWKSDGTAAGTVLVKDINPGSGGSDPQDLTNFNGTLFFSANDGTDGTELWKSDGTTAGTVLVADINPGSAYIAATKTSVPYSSNPTNLTAVGGTLFFTANDGRTGINPWKTDGTAQGTMLVKDIGDGAFPNYLTSFQGELYFAANSATGNELWKSDGTDAGTMMVKDIYPGTHYDSTAGGIVGNSSYPGPFTAFNGALYFSANDGNDGFELWKTDGTDAGTVLVKDVNPGPNSSGYYGPAYLTVAGGTLFFAADDGQSGNELWKSDGTAAGTVLVQDIVPGSYGSDPTNLTNVNGTLFFDALQDDVTGNDELFKSNGTAAGTVLVADINPGPDGSYLKYPIAVNGTLYFTADDGAHGLELWQSDGTAQGTNLVEDLNPGAAAANPANLTNADGTLFFTANDGVHGTELWALHTNSVAGNSAGGGSLTSAVSVKDGFTSASVPSELPTEQRPQRESPKQSPFGDRAALRDQQLAKIDQVFLASSAGLPGYVRLSDHATDDDRTADTRIDRGDVSTTAGANTSTTTVMDSSESICTLAAMISSTSIGPTSNETAPQRQPTKPAGRTGMLSTAVDQVLSARVGNRSRRGLHIMPLTPNNNAFADLFASDLSQF